MTKSEILAYLADKPDDGDFTLTPAPDPPTPPPTPPDASRSKNLEQIKSDTSITMTAAEFMQLVDKHKEPPKEEQKEANVDEFYVF